MTHAVSVPNELHPYETMANRSIELSDELYQYLIDHSLREQDVLRRLRVETAAHPESGMQIAPEQGQFMAFLVRLLGARTALEIGVFTGYSSTAVAMALPDDGLLVACDVSEEYTRVAQKYWKEAGVDHKIDLRIGPALQTLDTLLAGGAESTFDFAFIDADKLEYPSYFERSLSLVRPGGVIALDNMFRGGRVLNPTDAGTQAIRTLTETLHRDERVDVSLVPIADGLMLVRKR